MCLPAKTKQGTANDVGTTHNTCDGRTCVSERAAERGYKGPKGSKIRALDYERMPAHLECGKSFLGVEQSRMILSECRLRLKTKKKSKTTNGKKKKKKLGPIASIMSATTRTAPI